MPAVMEVRSAYERNICGFGYLYGGVYPTGIMLESGKEIQSSGSKKFFSWEEFFTDEKRFVCPYCILGVEYSFFLCGGIINECCSENNSLEYLFFNKYSKELFFNKYSKELFFNKYSKELFFNKYSKELFFNKYSLYLCVFFSLNPKDK
jgi:hypothetical protein